MIIIYSRNIEFIFCCWEVDNSSHIDQEALYFPGFPITLVTLSQSVFFMHPWCARCSLCSLQLAYILYLVGQAVQALTTCFMQMQLLDKIEP